MGLWSISNQKYPQYQLSFRLHHLNLPLYMEEHAPFISLLKQAYQTVTGKEQQISMQQEAARMHARYKDAVSHFGPLFEDEPNRNMHDANEHIDIKRFMKHGEICLQAMHDI